ncbi:maleylacetoacetate isomerase [Endozoicomonas sp. SM1973]|uniref:Maleylacetoacetate isomerase n=1 Tax=Spartinivicinus marinus TaxID=2994442 RepID=A0A853IFR2_9GAMM|nr:maleylacetoacetate isomerase [Spartinivicinus marinus]
MNLYSYWRSSAAYRVRIALNWKGLPYKTIPVHLVNEGGQQHHSNYKALNPQELVPTIQLDGMTLGQSMAILEYLEEHYPERPLLPADNAERAAMRAFALAIACDIHPLNNLRVLQYLTQQLGVSDQQKQQWYSHWVITGFAALEAQLTNTAGTFCFGDEFSLADVVLIPQVYNANRFNITLNDFSNISRIYEYCQSIPAVKNAAPEMQPDAE